MTTEQKRAVLLERYPGSLKIQKMPDYQIHAMYMRVTNPKKNK